MKVIERIRADLSLVGYTVGGSRQRATIDVIKLEALVEYYEAIEASRRVFVIPRDESDKIITRVQAARAALEKEEG